MNIWLEEDLVDTILLECQQDKGSEQTNQEIQQDSPVETLFKSQIKIIKFKMQNTKTS